MSHEPVVLQASPDDLRLDPERVAGVVGDSQAYEPWAVSTAVARTERDEYAHTQRRRVPCEVALGVTRREPNALRVAIGRGLPC